MTLPLVTIGIPTVRRVELLKEAVESALAQTWPNIEVLVGDNGTTAEIPDWCRERALKDPRLHYHRNPRDLGLAGNWNAIASRAAGEFIILSADDDLLLPEFVARLMSSAAPDSAVVFCNHYVIDERGRRLEDESRRITAQYHRFDRPAGRVENSAIAAWQMAICICSAIVRRAEVARLGFHDGLTSPDIEFFIRLGSERKRFDFVPDYLTEYRVHATTLTGGGLKNDALVARLLAIPATEDAEPYKRELLGRLLVNAASRSLKDGNWAQAREFLSSDYYPRGVSRLQYLTQRMFTALPRVMGSPLYRAVLQLKQASGR